MVDDIVEVDNHADSREEMIEVLDRHKEQAQKRGTTCAKKGDENGTSTIHKGNAGCN